MGQRSLYPYPPKSTASWQPWSAPTGGFLDLLDPRRPAVKDSDAAALKEDGYLVLKELDNGKSIAVTRMFASTALCLMTEDYNDKAVKRYWDGRERRFCYQHHVEAVLAGLLW